MGTVSIAVAAAKSAVSARTTTFRKVGGSGDGATRFAAVSETDARAAAASPGTGFQNFGRRGHVRRDAAPRVHHRQRLPRLSIVPHEFHRRVHHLFHGEQFSLGLRQQRLRLGATNLGKLTADERGVRELRAQRVDAHAAGAREVREGFREEHHGGFGG